MNKTVNINVGGLFFHIDENAYIKLNNYLKAIKASLAEDSKEEVMNDIEIRISEIFTSRIKQDKQVVNLLDIEYVIDIMGQPEDYIIEEDFVKPEQPNYDTESFNKKLYRDEDEGKIGGVCAGLGHYFGIDSIWIRLLFIFLFFVTAGTSLLIYFILWVIVPKAITTSEKLQMKGQPINISNIEKKIKESFDSEELNRKSKNVVSGIESFLKKTFYVISKFFGVFLLFISIVSLGGILIFGGTLMLASASLIDTVAVFDIPFESMTLFWFALLTTLTSGIPFLFLILFSFKILNPNFKTFGRYTTLSLLIIWFLSILGWIAFGIRQGAQEQYVGRVTEKMELNLSPTDTLLVNFNNNSFYSAEENPSYSGKVMLNENGEKVLYSNRVELIFKETDATPYVLIEKNARAAEIGEATKIATDIRFNTQVNQTSILADNYYTSDNKNKKNRKSVKLYVYVPKNTVIKMNKEARNFSNTFLNSNQKSDAPLFSFDSNNLLTCVNCETIIDPVFKPNQPTNLEFEIDSILNATN
ncbi:PspC domain-containing protein [Flavobacterium agricola]|uniref:PspC domain-containing protein n=1 Tax=Flavobacterium agricola TaxID=2870839 RepID=A0ABY6LVE9_9FLAO|nr:PspC domain-containing protein [Flavobacterium agricola]UYW00307.1 PspC domain-containing protein [Flavobacterium agricola]